MADNSAPPSGFDFSELKRVLDEKKNKPQVISEADFRRFEPMFNPEVDLNSPEIRSIASQYMATFDLFNVIHVINTAGEIIRIVPPEFTQFPTASGESFEAIRAESEMLNRTNLPKDTARGTAMYYSAVLSQGKTDKFADNAGANYRILHDMFGGLEKKHGDFIRETMLTDDKVDTSPQKPVDNDEQYGLSEEF